MMAFRCCHSHRAFLKSESCQKIRLVFISMHPNILTLNRRDSITLLSGPDLIKENGSFIISKQFLLHRLFIFKLSCPNSVSVFLSTTLKDSVSFSGFGSKNVNPSSHTGSAFFLKKSVCCTLLPTSIITYGSGSVFILLR